MVVVLRPAGVVRVSVRALPSQTVVSVRPLTVRVSVSPVIESGSAASASVTWREAVSVHVRPAGVRTVIALG